MNFVCDRTRSGRRKPGSGERARRAEQNHRAAGAVYQGGLVLARAAPRQRRRPRRGLAARHGNT
ncbi:hypothetical protein WJ30_10200 [Burkholderia diffusa]|nr:hypothetical protein WJ30_10200 [Burkholderia diffusa]